MGVVIVGGGFWGTAIALVLQSRGVEVTILDAGEDLAASPKAAGVINWEWFSRLQDASDEYKAHNAIWPLLPKWWDLKDSLHLARGFIERFTDYREFPERLTSYTGKPERTRTCHLVSPWLLLDKVQALKREEQAERLERVEGGSWAILTRQGNVLHAAAVVIAAGAWTDHLLFQSGLRPVGVSPLPGRALVLDQPAEDVRTHFINRYSQFTLRPWRAATSRLGDSVERKANSKTVQTLYLMRERLSPRSSVTEVLYGWRPITGRFHVERHAPGLVVATGGHRVGLAVAGAVAERAVTLLQEGG